MPSAFGEYDSNGAWVPIDLSGLTWTGANSVWLDFADSSSLGTDVNGNNSYTLDGLDSSNWTYDRCVDSDTTGNFNTFNRLFRRDVNFATSYSPRGVVSIYEGGRHI